jgi:succinate dehydrogenase hydrophobic anchor subunit
MVTSLVVAALCSCFFLALLDYVPNKYQIILNIFSSPLFRLLLSLIVVTFALLLMSVSGLSLIVLIPAASFLSHGILIFLKK